VVRDGYAQEFIERVDPSARAATAVLKPRAAVDDPTRVVRGQVVHSRGRPVRDAVVKVRGVAGPRGGMLFGSPIPGLYPLAVTVQGVFEVALYRFEYDSIKRNVQPASSKSDSERAFDNEHACNFQRSGIMAVTGVTDAGEAT
jgi:hypothetical protein